MTFKEVRENLSIKNSISSETILQKTNLKYKTFLGKQGLNLLLDLFIYKQLLTFLLLRNLIFLSKRKKIKGIKMVPCIYLT